MLGLGNSIITSGATSEDIFDGFSVEFDGDNDLLADADFPRSVLASAMSVSAWVNLDSKVANKIAVGAWSDANTFVLRMLGTSGYAQFGVRMANNGFRKVANTTDMTTTGWAHIVGTFKRNEYVKLYVNGSLIGTEAVSDYDLQLTDSNTDNSGTADNGVAIGVNATDQLVNDFDGHINDVAIWSAELDEDAVSVIWNSGTPTDLTADSGDYDNSSDLEAYWKMEEGTGTTVADSSGNNRDMTLEGDASFSTDTP
jgi:hypothetical protein